MVSRKEQPYLAIGILSAPGVWVEPLNWRAQDRGANMAGDSDESRNPEPILLEFEHPPICEQVLRKGMYRFDFSLDDFLPSVVTRFQP